MPLLFKLRLQLSSELSLLTLLSLLRLGFNLLFLLLHTHLLFRLSSLWLGVRGLGFRMSFSADLVPCNPPVAVPCLIAMVPCCYHAFGCAVCARSCRCGLNDVLMSVLHRRVELVDRP